MEINKEELWHIIQIMEDRGVCHCQFCRDLLIKLKKEFERLTS